MPFNAESRIEINKPAEAVIRFVFEPTNEPYWISGILESHMLSVRPVGRGTQVQRIQKLPVRTVDYVYEMVEFDPGGHLKLLSLDSRLNIEVEYFIEKAAGHSTVFRQVIRANPRGYLSILGFIAGRFMISHLSRDMKHLKEILEK